MTNTTSETDGLSPSRPPEDLLGRLSQSDPLADLIIDVEGHQLHTSKYMLANASSKFCQMLTDATSVNPNILPLPGVSLQAAVELLRWLLPSETLTISAKNIELVLRIALEYDITNLLEECDRWFVEKLKLSTRDEDFIKCMVLAQRYGLSVARELATDRLSRLTITELESLGFSTGVAVCSMPDILQRRLELIENGSLTPGNPTVPENVVLLVDDKEIVASSAALSMASDVFKSMIESDFRDHKTRQIAMHGKSYEAVKFMLDYITSQDYVPIPGDLLVDCIGLAREYKLGRMKHACTEYMLSNAAGLQLNNALLYLCLAHRYEIPSVEKKIISMNYQTSTADILKCSNYNIRSAGSLMLKRAQWLETQVKEREIRLEKEVRELENRRYKEVTTVNNRLQTEMKTYEKKLETTQKSYEERISDIWHLMDDYKSWVSESVSEILVTLHDAMNIAREDVNCNFCGKWIYSGHSFTESCGRCASLGKIQFKQKLEYIYRERKTYEVGFTKASFLEELRKRSSEINNL